MPSVEMRRSTRVFVPKTKDGDAVRVLRSGRRLWVESGLGKFKVSAGRGDGKVTGDWFPSADDLALHKDKLWRETSEMKEADDDSLMKVDDDDDDKLLSEMLVRTPNASPDVGSPDKKFKNVYRRKRKRFDSSDSRTKVNSEGVSCDNKFGLYFVRRQTRKRTRMDKSSVFPSTEGSSQQHNLVGGVDGIVDYHGLLSVVVESAIARSGHLADILSSILRRMTKAELSLVQLSAFLLSKPIGDVFASSGIRFLWNRTHSEATGLCKILGARQFIPMFNVHFSAVPLSFMHLHANMFFRYSRLSYVVYNSLDFPEESERSIGDAQPCHLQISAEAFGNVHARAPKVGNLNLGLPKLAGRTSQHRNGVSTRGVQKRRSRSLRTRRARRNPSLLSLNRASGVLLADLLGSRKLGSPISRGVNNHELRRSARKSSCEDARILKSALSAVGEDIESLYCSANILVIEADKCFRVKGASVMLECPSPTRWVLAVKEDGQTKYLLKAQKEMRPVTTNRYTHALIWVAESGWKLEFLERKDWVIFKELYKVCGERDVVPPPPTEKSIPVPGLCEVPQCGDMNAPPFTRPESYIKTNDDELSRALLRRSANYDMDSEDEEWLSKFNRELDSANEHGDKISEETFELMIDAFEKASYCSPDDYSDENGATNLCLDLARREVVEAVCSYWLKRRKKKRSSLVMVFQLNKPKKAEATAKPILRKKRSLKRQIQCGRGKDRSVLQAMAAARSAVEERNAMLKIQEAKASASTTLELSIKKRQRAQVLMENADLAMYRATMALRIAEAAQVAESNEATADFLDE